MNDVLWDPKARDFLRKIPKQVAKRIYKKINLEVKNNPQRYLLNLVGKNYQKIRGEYRVFANYDPKKNFLHSCNKA